MNILLHICCGVCAAAVAEKLNGEGHSVTGFFYNPNIFHEGEYKKRLGAARESAARSGIAFLEGGYDHEAWKKMISGFEDEPEGARRCAVCFSMRLEETFELCVAKGFDRFTTTLSVSPHKNPVIINGIGSSLSREKFLAADFKKDSGFKRTIALAKEWGLYRQGYCGCEYSVRE